jgi:hypothetical protein
MTCGVSKMILITYESDVYPVTISCALNVGAGGYHSDSTICERTPRHRTDSGFPALTLRQRTVPGSYAYLG